MSQRRQHAFANQNLIFIDWRLDAAQRFDTASSGLTQPLTPACKIERRSSGQIPLVLANETSDLVSFDSALHKLARRLHPGVRKRRDQKKCPLAG